MVRVSTLFCSTSLVWVLLLYASIIIVQTKLSPSFSVRHENIILEKFLLWQFFRSRTVTIITIATNKTFSRTSQLSFQFNKPVRRMNMFTSSCKAISRHANKYEDYMEDAGFLLDIQDLYLFQDILNCKKYLSRILCPQAQYFLYLRKNRQQYQTHQLKFLAQLWEEYRIMNLFFSFQSLEAIYQYDPFENVVTIADHNSLKWIKGHNTEKIPDRLRGYGFWNKRPKHVFIHLPSVPKNDGHPFLFCKRARSTETSTARHQSYCASEGPPLRCWDLRNCPLFVTLYVHIQARLVNIDELTGALEFEGSDALLGAALASIMRFLPVLHPPRDGGDGGGGGGDDNAEFEESDGGDDGVSGSDANLALTFAMNGKATKDDLSSKDSLTNQNSWSSVNSWDTTISQDTTINRDSTIGQESLLMQSRRDSQGVRGATGAIRELQEQRADIAFNQALMRYAGGRGVDFLPCIGDGRLRLLAPSSPQKALWRQMAHALAGGMWAALGGALLGVGVTVATEEWARALRKRRRRRMSAATYRAISLVAAAVGYPSRVQRALPVALKPLAATLLLFAIVFVAALQGATIDVLTNPRYEAELDSLEAVAQSELQVISLMPMFIHTLQGDSEALRLLRRRVITKPPQEAMTQGQMWVDRVRLKRDVVVLLSEIGARLALAQAPSPRYVHLVRQPVASYRLALMTRRASPLAPCAATIVLRIVETGIWSALTSRDVRSALRAAPPSPPPVSSSIQHLAPAFTLLAVGALAAALVLAVERFVAYAAQVATLR